MKAMFNVVAILCVALALTACGFWPDASYRYKLTLSVNTPDGVKTASNVVEIDYWKVQFPASGEPHKTTGQALYLDLGHGRRPLVALLTRFVRDKELATRHFAPWGYEGPLSVISVSCFGAERSKYLTPIEAVRLVNQECRRPLVITPADLPDLVTFTDNDPPHTLLMVDPNDLEATLGQGVSWKSITIEATDDPIAKGIETHLPWATPMGVGMTVAPGVHHAFFYYDFIGGR